MSRLSFFFALLLLAACTSQVAEVDAALPNDAAVVVDVGADAATTRDAGHDAAAPIDAGHDAYVGRDAYEGLDAWVDPDAYVDQGDTGGQDAATPTCGPGMRVCECATGWYCVHLGASCLLPTAPCPG